MKLTILAIGRLRAGPEKLLIDDYMDRAGKTGRALALGPATVVELEDKRGGGKPAEAELLRRAVPPGAVVVAMDERGKVLSSPGFAGQLAKWRDTGRPEVVLMIGGADGLDPALVAEADFALSFGKMVWPHMLARVMLAEQLYRAVSILAGTPYHRE
ncbi:23S rRNA (pseudouridine(1915)-N(3))-methyltransferase RlmH [Vannielia litorea]|uniref:Ribosomal RNA large subunit methyltransferase H n=1 Tax=Vannielia litorea TaxID=1217970 RepID=A0A1N6II52_9RHOB|nr:23S rRNA (pseudouridine(1915)-N(3))-methyltransferase RlmH [Vannielia litorea]SIO31655.1 23S rRNA (pseudouridine1915-N3)-methyltransferase [Vannielia litorea]